MKFIKILLSVVILINVTGCQTTRQSLFPHDGPTMEQVYDGMSREANNTHDTANALPAVRKQLRPVSNHMITLPKVVSAKATSNEFQKIDNPEIKLYIFPHFAGTDELPVPGYTTVMNLYPRDHYVLKYEGN